jgi:hypothetical protein
VKHRPGLSSPGFQRAQYSWEASSEALSVSGEVPLQLHKPLYKPVTDALCRWSDCCGYIAAMHDRREERIAEENRPAPSMGWELPAVSPRGPSKPRNEIALNRQLAASNVARKFRLAPPIRIMWTHSILLSRVWHAEGDRSLERPTAKGIQKLSEASPAQCRNQSRLHGEFAKRRSHSAVSASGSRRSIADVLLIYRPSTAH